MKNRRASLGILLTVGAAALVAALAGCSSAPPATSVDAGAFGDERQPYVTSGRAIRMLEAMNQTTIEAIKLAVVDIIGEEYAEAYHAKLAQVLYGTNNPNAYIFTDETEVIILDHELEVDPCLSPAGIATIMSLINDLKLELEGTRLRIRELKGSSAA